MVWTGITYPVPCLASSSPPELLATTGMPRSIASITINPNPSYHSDGFSSTRTCASTSSMSFTFGRNRTLGNRSSARRSAAVVPHPGTTPNSYSGSRSAVSRKIEMPFTAQGLIITIKPRSKFP